MLRFSAESPERLVVRSESLCDVKLVCKDGDVFAHQFLLGRQSAMLREAVRAQAGLLELELIQPKLAGLPLKLKEVSRQHQAGVVILLPDYSKVTTELLLDLLYTGRAQHPRLEQHAPLMRSLYADLGLGSEHGGLPDIAELDTFEVEVFAAPSDAKVTPSTENSNQPAAREELISPISSPGPGQSEQSDPGKLGDGMQTTTPALGNLFSGADTNSPPRGSSSPRYCEISVPPLCPLKQAELGAARRTRPRSDGENSHGADISVNTANQVKASNSRMFKEKEESGENEVTSSDSTAGVDPMSYCEVKFEVDYEDVDDLLDDREEPLHDLQLKLDSVFKVDSSNSKENKALGEDSDDGDGEEEETSEAVIRPQRNIRLKKREAPGVMLVERQAECKLKLTSVNSRKRRRGPQTRRADDDYVPPSKFDSSAIPIKRARRSTRSKSKEKVSTDQAGGEDESLTEGTKEKLEETTQFELNPIDLTSPQEEASSKLQKPQNFVCPVQGCNLMTNLDDGRHPKIYNIIKHLISSHLRWEPSRLYMSAGEVERRHGVYQCNKCTKGNESKTSILSHMAYKHADLWWRVKRALLHTSSGPERQLYTAVDGFLQEEWPDEWQQSFPVRDNKDCSVRLSPIPVILCKTCCLAFKSDTEFREHTSRVHQFKQLLSPSKSPKIDVVVKNGNEILHNEGLDEAKNCESETADKKEEPIVSKSNVIIETQWGTVNNEPTNQLEVEAASPGEADGPEKQRGFRCKFCYFKYREDVAELREHVISQHSDKFETIPLLEAGEKHFECSLCSKKTQLKKYHRNHLKSTHNIVTKDLIESDESWREGIVTFEDLCVETDEDWEVSRDGWKPVTQRHISAAATSSKREPPPVDIVLKKPENAKVHEKPSNMENNKTSENEDNNSSEIIEEYVHIARRKKTPKSCNVCDKQFRTGTEVSSHLFHHHVHTMTDEVWNELFRESAANMFQCLVCDKRIPFSASIKVKQHIYNVHKKELKRKMDEKNVDWKNLLDFIRYDVVDNEEVIIEIDLEADNESKVESPYYEIITSPDTEDLNELPEKENTDVVEGMNESGNMEYPENISQVEVMLNEKIVPQDATESKQVEDKCPESQPIEEEIKPVPVKENISELTTENLKKFEVMSRNSQCMNREQEPADESKGRDREQGQSHGRNLGQAADVPCYHSRRGCHSRFSCKNEMTEHARACPLRPTTKFPCSHCSKSFYYQQDFEKHQNKHKKMNKD